MTECVDCGRPIQGAGYPERFPSTFIPTAFKGRRCDGCHETAVRRAQWTATRNFEFVLAHRRQNGESSVAPAVHQLTL